MNLGDRFRTSSYRLNALFWDSERLWDEACMWGGGIGPTELQLPDMAQVDRPEIPDELDRSVDANSWVTVARDTLTYGILVAGMRIMVRFDKVGILPKEPV